MDIPEPIARHEPEIAAWRRDIHAHPELGYEEHRTGDLVARLLAAFDLEVHRGLGKTGVVGTLRRGNGGPAIGLRADMDALPIQELNTFDHRSVHPGKMHACGHDGHTAMLLGAAWYLAQRASFDGVVHFIFQPAEEGLAGAQTMIDDGLFERFPAERVFGMHNWPGLAVGRFAVRPGPIMAAADRFEIRVRGRGSHAAMPHQGVDPILVASHIVVALQALTSRNTDPADSVVVSVAQINGGDTFNVIPDAVTLTGTVRSLQHTSRDRTERNLRAMAEQVAAAFGAKAETVYHRDYPATVNSAAETTIAAAAAAAVVGESNVLRDLPPSMGAEDFSFMLDALPGCYLWIGNGATGDGCPLHNPNYDFNDDILTIGASYWVRLVERVLPESP